MRIYNNALAALKEKHKDDAEAFDKEYRELLDQDSELVIEKIPVSELGDLHLTPAWGQVVRIWDMDWRVE